MSLHHAQAPGLRPPEVAGDKVIATRWQRAVIKRVLGEVANEKLIEVADIPTADEQGATALTPILAAYTALGLGVLAEAEKDERRRPFMEQRALLFGEAALRAGEVQEPSLAVSEPELNFELLDMVEALRANRRLTFS